MPCDSLRCIGCAGLLMAGIAREWNTSLSKLLIKKKNEKALEAEQNELAKQKKIHFSSFSKSLSLDLILLDYCVPNRRTQNEKFRSLKNIWWPISANRSGESLYPRYLYTRECLWIAKENSLHIQFCRGQSIHRPAPKNYARYCRHRQASRWLAISRSSVF